MATSYVSPGLVAKIAAKQANAFATRKALRGTVSLVLSRMNPDNGEPANLPAQEVVVSLANRQAQERDAAAASVLSTEGTFSKEAPFDVRAGDRFVLPNGVGGYVKVPTLGTGPVLRAGFVLELG